MGELFFFLKSLMLTLVFVLLMQIRIGPTTIEEKVLSWSQNSSFLQPIQTVADGGVVALREGWQKLSQAIGSKFQGAFNSENWPGTRSLGINIERSQAVLKEQAKKAKSKIQEGLEHLQDSETYSYEQGQ